jgi:hypothetical protein
LLHWIDTLHFEDFVLQFLVIAMQNAATSGYGVCHQARGRGQGGVEEEEDDEEDLVKIFPSPILLSSH